MSLPLEGMLVLDLSSLQPGSMCAQFLGDLGAEVVKIEHPQGQVGLRTMPPLVKTMSSVYHIVNRNKQSLTLDLKHPAGRKVLRQLACRTDVFLENGRPGAMDQMGLGYDDLKALNPRIIYCAITGFGQDGPYRDRPTHDLNVLAIAGILDLMGEKAGGPAVPAVQMAGTGAAGVTAAMAILAALLRREQTGAGQYLDVGILDCLSPFLCLIMSQYMTDGQLPRRGESWLGGGNACYNVYETKDGKFLSIGCLEEKFWAALCRALGRQDLTGDHAAPPRRQAEVIAILKAIFLEKTREEWIAILEEGRDICFAPVNTLEEALQDPQVRHRGLWFKAPHPVDGHVAQQAYPVKCDTDQPGFRTPPPSLGEHTRPILKGLGYDEAAIDALAAQGVI